MDFSHTTVLNEQYESYLNEAVALNENFIKDLYRKIKSGNEKKAFEMALEKKRQSNKKMKEIKKTYEKVYNVNIANIEKIAKHNIKIEKNNIKNAVLTKNSEKLKLTFGKIFKNTIQFAVKPVTDLSKIDTNSIEFDKSMTNLIILIIIGMLTSQISIILFGSGITAMVVSGCITAPIIEEYFKRMSIKEKYGNQYIFVFAWAEFLIYMLPAVFGISSINVVIIGIIRYLVVLMHYSAFGVQSYFVEKMKNSKGEESKKDIIGLFAGILIHGTWNILGTISQIT